MNKKIIKCVSRVVCGLITVFFGLTTVVALFPDESYHHCEAGQEDLSPVWSDTRDRYSVTHLCSPPWEDFYDREAVRININKKRCLI